MRAKIAPNRLQKHAIFKRNQRKFAPKMRDNDGQSHSKTALMSHIIISTSRTTPVCVVHSQRACRAEKRCKNRREHVRFSCTFFCIFRAERTAHSKIWCKLGLHDVQGLPAMIASVFRSMRASCAPKSHQIGCKNTRFSSETGANSRPKCATTTANHIQKLR